MGSGFVQERVSQYSRLRAIADYRKVWPFPTKSLAIENDATELLCCVNSIQGLDTTPA
jgi:hypothetical protein